MIVAIDGPSGAGKSTVSKAVAARIGFSCLDTGAMYRAVAWQALENGVSLDDAEGLERIARTYDIDFIREEGNPIPQGTTIGGVDVSTEIRTARIDRSVSLVSKVAGVRAALVDQQRRIGHAGNYVVEGRDIGTVVFPDAYCKVFLTASAEERARRRVAQNAQRGVGSTDYEEVLADIRHRDEVDSTRAESPLVPADDAVQIDSTNYTIDQMIDMISNLAIERQASASKDKA